MPRNVPTNPATAERTCSVDGARAAVPVAAADDAGTVAIEPVGREHPEPTLNGSPLPLLQLSLPFAWTDDMGLLVLQDEVLYSVRRKGGWVATQEGIAGFSMGGDPA